MKKLRLTLAWAAAALGATAQGAEIAGLSERLVGGLSTDSRNLRPGDIFVALAGEKFDGHDYADQALERGALAVATHRPLKGRAARLALTVPDTLAALGALAGRLRRESDVKVIGLTGSNGKTGTKEMLASILPLAAPTLATQGNFNNLVGLPLTLTRLTPETRLAVLEMGMSHFGEIARLTEIARPDAGLITSVGAAHLEFFGTVGRVAAAKGELYAGLRPDAVAVVNADEPLLRREARRFGGVKLTFGLGPAAEIRLKNWRSLGLKGQSFALYGPGAAQGRRTRLKLPGAHNGLNALAAAAAALAVGLDWEVIVAGLERAESIPGRLSPRRGRGGLWVIDDSYNANPTSMAAGLDFLAGLKNSRPVGAILGDMLELGDVGPREHRRLGRLAAELKLDFLALVGPLSLHTAGAANRAGLTGNRTVHFETPREAAVWAAAGRPRGTVILVKGSHSMRMDEAVKYLTEGR